MRSDHLVGTFWYHLHKNGLVASQYAPGMAGTLIVREKGIGDEDFDTLLAQHEIAQVDQEIIVI
jgi:FtsP/CotA-like multicopper oxidase with cupredoxin domain